MTKPVCKTCRFFQPINDPRGECRRYPDFIDRDYGQARVLMDSSWCGEHKPKTPIVTKNLT